MTRWSLWLLLGLSFNLCAQSQLEGEQAERYHELNAELRCLVCQNQTIAESNAPLAKDLREQVETQILAGRSNEQILAYMTERYGDFVRYRPPWSGRTVMLWLGPFLLVLVGLIVLRRSLFRSGSDSQNEHADQMADPQIVKRILDEVSKR